MLTIQPIMNSIDATNGSKQSDDFQSAQFNNDDDFGDFADFQNNKIIDDDFGDFTFFQSKNTEYRCTSNNDRLKESDQGNQIEANNDDFGDFTSFQDGSCDNNKSIDEDDDFGDFSSFTCNDKSKLPTNCEREDKDLNFFSNVKIDDKLERVDSNVEEEDDFGDFANFQEASSVIADGETTRSIVDNFLPSDAIAFPPKDEPSSVDDLTSNSVLSSIVCQSFDKGIQDDGNKTISKSFFGDTKSQSYKMWQSLINWEEAASLKLNWESSHTFQVFLRSLKIDSKSIQQMPGLRNISTPLIPSKLTIVQPTPLPSIIPLEPQVSQQMSQDPMNSLEKQEQSASTIPEANFDWSSSGLTNPLEKDWLILL